MTANLKEQILRGMGYFSRDFKGQPIAGTDKPWLFTSGCNGMVRCELPLIDSEACQQADLYTVRLGFRAPTDDTPGQRVFDIKLQDKVVYENCDIAQLAGGTDEAVVKDIPGIPVSSTLRLELVPKSSLPTDTTAPIINVIEVRREG